MEIYYLIFHVFQEMQVKIEVIFQQCCQQPNKLVQPFQKTIRQYTSIVQKYLYCKSVVIKIGNATYVSGNVLSTLHVLTHLVHLLQTQDKTPSGYYHHLYFTNQGRGHRDAMALTPGFITSVGQYPKLISGDFCSFLLLTTSKNSS